MTTFDVNNPNGYYYRSEQDGQYYKRRSAQAAEIGYVLAGLGSALVYKALPSFSKPFLKQMPKEHANNHLYKDIFEKAIEKSGLLEKGLELVHDANPVTEIGKGLNACYIPTTKQIVLNKDLATISGFHELGHACNHLKKGFGSIMQKLRRPGMAVAALMASVAVLSRNKPKGEKRNIADWVQDNCGKIAFISMLPTVIEETMASYKGIKFAKEAGLGKPLIENLKKFYGKALMSYGGYALIAGVAVYVSSKIMEMFTRPQKVENPEFY